MPRRSLCVTGRECPSLKWLAPMLLLAVVLPAYALPPTANKYEPGTITAVKNHKNSVGETDVARYEVSVKVGNMVYTVLYTPPNGANSVEYFVGFQTLVLVGKDTLTFNSNLSGTTIVPILRREAIPAPKGIDWSNAPGQYFSLKQRHLSESLSLTGDQQAKIKPLLEQEAAEANEFLGNPAISRKDKVNRWEKLVQSFDQQMQPVLSGEQIAKLQDLRKQQKQDLKKLISGAKEDQPN